jgi:hypothetical protein
MVAKCVLFVIKPKISKSSFFQQASGLGSPGHTLDPELQQRQVRFNVGLGSRDNPHLN